MSTCRSCKVVVEKAGRERMHRLGFRNCAWLPDWHYLSGHSACRFNPSRWSQKS
ncbi:hypothetical protein AWB80_03588 [Caballeronia pedi]|uniref:Uncharacterized protein n=1 Tax=Caballeronia pedi TaxID=1777141 RepID=A0A158BJX8_9BURK|nr:hypothetical protein AWB80_03588 [Caballeronia pedi]